MDMNNYGDDISAARNIIYIRMQYYLIAEYICFIV